MTLKAKNKDILNKKIKEYQDKKVIKFLNAIGYNCTYEKNSIIAILKKLKQENKKVMIYRNNEKLIKLSNYYKYTVNLKISLERI